MLVTFEVLLKRVSKIALLAVYVYLSLFIHKDSVLRALFNAVAALDAAVGKSYYFLFEIDHLRIMAPSAVKRTALEEHRGTYSRTVFSTELLQRPHKSR